MRSTPSRSRSTAESRNSPSRRSPDARSLERHRKLICRSLLTTDGGRRGRAGEPRRHTKSPLTLTPIDHLGLCHGWAWTIQDESILAERVARVAVGQYRHVARILAGANVPSPGASTDHAANAIKLLTVAPGNDPWHRDGWVFQTLSWIAAQQMGPGAVTRPPQILKADKGFDGMQLELAADGKSVTAVIVFEDKATDNARKTIREEVWPGIVALEAGERVSELTHQTTAMLEAQQRLDPALDIDTAISNILWKEVRRYRVSITVNDTHLDNTARAGLFKGFDESAPGDAKRRRAETIHLPELRKWMSAFAGRAIDHVKAMTVYV